MHYSLKKKKRHHAWLIFIEIEKDKGSHCALAEISSSYTGEGEKG